VEFSTLLLREKFIIRDGDQGHLSATSVTATGNRVIVPLTNTQGHTLEKFIVRAQTMHTALRMAAKIVQSYQAQGPLMVRAEKFKFQEVWDDITEDFDRLYQRSKWCVVYNKGQRVFATGDHHIFLDLIEKCDAQNDQDYDASVRMAEKSFASMGRTVSISHDSHVAMVLTVKDKTARCGLILRNPKRKTTFNILAEQKTIDPVTIIQSLFIAATFLEGIQICFELGSKRKKFELRLEEVTEQDVRFEESAQKRLDRLTTDIDVFENQLSVRYRPEKPDFAEMIEHSEEFIEKYFEANEDSTA
jgi:hypothetical protein